MKKKISMKKNVFCRVCLKNMLSFHCVNDFQFINSSRDLATTVVYQELPYTDEGEHVLLIDTQSEACECVCMHA